MGRFSFSVPYSAQKPLKPPLTPAAAVIARGYSAAVCSRLISERPRVSGSSSSATIMMP